MGREMPQPRPTKPQERNRWNREQKSDQQTPKQQQQWQSNMQEKETGERASWKVKEVEITNREKPPDRKEQKEQGKETSKEITENWIVRTIKELQEPPPFLERRLF